MGIFPVSSKTYNNYVQKCFIFTVSYYYISFRIFLKAFVVGSALTFIYHILHIILCFICMCEMRYKIYCYVLVLSSPNRKLWEKFMTPTNFYTFSPEFFLLQNLLLSFTEVSRVQSSPSHHIFLSSISISRPTMMFSVQNAVFLSSCSSDSFWINHPNSFHSRVQI